VLIVSPIRYSPLPLSAGAERHGEQMAMGR
jgi:hypothetical protein